MSIFSERLSELIESRDVTRKLLAEFLGVTYKTINNYENGTREPNFAQLRKIAEYLHVNSSYLIGDSDDPTPSTFDDNNESEPKTEDENEGPYTITEVLNEAYNLGGWSNATEMMEFASWVLPMVNGQIFFHDYMERNEALPQLLKDQIILWKLERKGK